MGAEGGPCPLVRSVISLLSDSAEYSQLVGEPAARLVTRTQEFVFHASETP